MSQENGKLAGKANMTDEERLRLAQAMMDASFTDIEELAQFVNPPKGLYFIERIVKCEQGLNNEGTGLVIKLMVELGEAIELAAFPGMAPADLPEGTVPAVGSLVSYNFHGPMGIQQLALAFKPVITEIDPLMTPRVLVETLGSGSLTGLTMSTTLQASKDKMDPESVAAGDPKPVMYSKLISVMMA